MCVFAGKYALRGTSTVCRCGFGAYMLTSSAVMWVQMQTNVHSIDAWFELLMM